MLSFRNLLPFTLAVSGAFAPIHAQDGRLAKPTTTESPITPFVYCGTGDHLWNSKVEPVDSAATISAMCEWMAKTYGVKRLYWRGGQDEIWREHFKQIGHDALIQDWIKWKSHLYGDLKLNAAAVAAAKKNGMEIFLYTGLFEAGIQPDVGIIHPYLFEDSLRIEHPEWCPLDRWHQRRSPGPISFAYPEAREAVIDRLMEQVDRFGYDGINFYTYVENLGIRYEDEFGYNQPIADEFNRIYPNVDLRNDTLTPDQKKHWHKCQGIFVTTFLSELHERLSLKKKKLSMILDATEPDYAQRWWGKKLNGAGKIYLDWEKWIDDGIVDEIWVQLGPLEDQEDLLDRLLAKCAGKPIKLTVRTPDPLAPSWVPYVKQGVTPVATITWEKNGIERISLEPTSLKTLRSADWKVRAQTLDDIAHGKFPATFEDVYPLVKDSEVLVRQRAVRALGSIKGEKATAALERALEEPETSIRIAAVNSLVSSHGGSTAKCIIETLKKGEQFQFKLASVSALTAVGSDALPLLLENLDNPNPDVREICIRVLCKIPAIGHRSEIYRSLRKTMLNKEEDILVRTWALKSLSGVYQNFTPEIPPNEQNLPSDLVSLLSSDEPVDLQLHAAEALERLNKSMTQSEKEAVVAALERSFKLYGDDCTRPDAAYGWRVIGNAILTFGGKDRLEEMRKQTDDKWLAWNAYEVVYLFQDSVIKDKRQVFNEVDEKQAIAEHNQYAPTFPGWRKW